MRYPVRTIDDALLVGARLHVTCESCGRTVGPGMAVLSRQGYGRVPIAELKFRCERRGCGGPGRVRIEDWRDRSVWTDMTFGTARR